MEFIQSRRAIEIVAEKEGVAVDMVVSEMEHAIEQAFFQAVLENNEERLRMWRDIPRTGDIPNAEELIAYVAKRILDEKAAPVG